MLTEMDTLMRCWPTWHAQVREMRRAESARAEAEGIEAPIPFEMIQREAA